MVHGFDLHTLHNREGPHVSQIGASETYFGQHWLLDRDRMGRAKLCQEAILFAQDLQSRAPLRAVSAKLYVGINT